MSTVYLYYTFHYEKAKELSLIKKCAHDYTGISAIEPNIVVNEYGKPDFDSCMHFNLSHSKDLWVCALYSEEIGVDTEFIRNKDYSRVARSVFEETPDSNAEFFRKWCQKEAYLKYIGKGLSALHKQIDEDLSYQYADIDENYVVCICTKEKADLKIIGI